MFKKIMKTPLSKLLEVMAFWILSLWFFISLTLLAEYNIIRSIGLMTEPTQASLYDVSVVLIFMIFMVLWSLILLGFITLTWMIVSDSISIIIQSIKEKRRNHNA